MSLQIEHFQSTDYLQPMVRASQASYTYWQFTHSTILQLGIVKVIELVTINTTFMDLTICVNNFKVVVKITDILW